MPEIISRKDARALGLKRYFTGSPCCHGHLCERMLSSGACLECKEMRRIVLLGSRHSPEELIFPDRYFQGRYRRAITGNGGKPVNIQYHNSRWMRQWDELLSKANLEVRALQRAINDLRRQLNDRSRRNSQGHEGNASPNLGCMGQDSQGEGETSRSANGNRRSERHAERA